MSNNIIPTEQKGSVHAPQVFYFPILSPCVHCVVLTRNFHTATMNGISHKTTHRLLKIITNQRNVGTEWVQILMKEIEHLAILIWEN